jgi:hypothetical protein
MSKRKKSEWNITVGEYRFPSIQINEKGYPGIYIPGITKMKYRENKK